MGRNRKLKQERREERGARVQEVLDLVLSHDMNSEPMALRIRRRTLALYVRFGMVVKVMRWAFTVWMAMSFFEQTNNPPFWVIQALISNISIFINHILPTFLEGARSAMEGYNAFKLFLRGCILQREIWFFFTSPFVFRWIMGIAALPEGLIAVTCFVLLLLF